MMRIANMHSIAQSVANRWQSKDRTIIPNSRTRKRMAINFLLAVFAEKMKLSTRTACLSCPWNEVFMRMKKTVWIVLAVCFCVVMLTVSAFADNYGGEDDFGVLGGSSEAATTEPAETVTTEPGATETTTEPVVSEPESSTAEETSDPDASESATTEPKGSVSGEETSEPAETGSGDATTERPDVQTTEPVESPSESETQSEQGTNMPLPLPVILAVLGVLCIGCIVVVAIVLIKYTRAQQA